MVVVSEQKADEVAGDGAGNGPEQDRDQRQVAGCYQGADTEQQKGAGNQQADDDQ